MGGTTSAPTATGAAAGAAPIPSGGPSGSPSGGISGGISGDVAALGEIDVVAAYAACVRTGILIPEPLQLHRRRETSPPVPGSSAVTTPSGAAGGSTKAGSLLPALLRAKGTTAPQGTGGEDGWIVHFVTGCPDLGSASAAAGLVEEAQFGTSAANAGGCCEECDKSRAPREEVSRGWQGRCGTGWLRLLVSDRHRARTRHQSCPTCVHEISTRLRALCGHHPALLTWLYWAHTVVRDETDDLLAGVGDVAATQDGIARILRTHRPDPHLLMGRPPHPQGAPDSACAAGDLTAARTRLAEVLMALGSQLDEKAPRFRAARYARTCWVRCADLPLPHQPSQLAMQAYWLQLAAIGDSHTDPVPVEGQTCFRIRHSRFDALLSWQWVFDGFGWVTDTDPHRSDLATAVRLARGDNPDRYDRLLTALRAAE